MPEAAGSRLRASRLNQYANADIFNSLGGCLLSGITSATYVDITSASKSFTKIGGSAASDLIVRVNLSCYVSVAATVVKIGVRINGTDTDVMLMSINTASAHTTMPPGAVRITGLAAGAYTIQLRALRVSGTGTVSIDSSDTVAMDIRERPI